MSLEAHLYQYGLWSAPVTGSLRQRGGPNPAVPPGEDTTKHICQCDYTGTVSSQAKHGGNVHSLLCRHHQQKATFIMYKWQRIMGKPIRVCLWASAVLVWLDVWTSVDLLDMELATPPAWATVWRCVWNCTTSEGAVLHAEIPSYWPLPLQPSLSWGEWAAQWANSESSPADTIMTTH